MLPATSHFLEPHSLIYSRVIFIIVRIIILTLGAHICNKLRTI